MRTLVVVLTLVVILLSPSMAFGQEYTRFRLPEGRRCTVAAEQYQCFDLGEYTELLRIDEDLRHLTDLHVSDLARIEALVQATDALNDAIGAANRSRSVLETENARLSALWQEENRLRQEAENAPNWDWVPWTIAGGFAISTLVLGLVVGL